MYEDTKGCFVQLAGCFMLANPAQQEVQQEVEHKSYIIQASEPLANFMLHHSVGPSLWCDERTLWLRFVPCCLVCPILFLKPVHVGSRHDLIAFCYCPCASAFQYLVPSDAHANSRVCHASIRSNPAFRYSASSSMPPTHASGTRASPGPSPPGIN